MELVGAPLPPLPSHSDCITSSKTNPLSEYSPIHKVLHSLALPHLSSLACPRSSTSHLAGEPTVRCALCCPLCLCLLSSPTHTRSSKVYHVFRTELKPPLLREEFLGSQRKGIPLLLDVHRNHGPNPSLDTTLYYQWEVLLFYLPTCTHLNSSTGL